MMEYGPPLIRKEDDRDDISTASVIANDLQGIGTAFLSVYGSTVIQKSVQDQKTTKTKWINETALDFLKI
jgi:hypothetical protein